jgi:hypothetical protein
LLRHKKHEDELWACCNRVPAVAVHEPVWALPSGDMADLMFVASVTQAVQVALSVALLIVCARSATRLTNKA